MFSFDLFANSIFSSIDNPFFTGAFYFATWLFDPVPFTILLTLSTLVTYKWYGKREALIFASAPVLAFILAWILKLSFNTVRPPHEMIYAFGPAFPSGHTAVATAYFLSILHFARRTKDRYRRTVHVLFCTLCPLFVGVSRLYFGVHWLSDVLFGYVIGGISVYVVIWLFKMKQR